MAKEAKKIVATAGTFDVLRKPIISEKSAKLAEANGLAFEIDPRATKTDVARAVQAIYNVKPAKVNIVVQKGKQKTFKGRIGTQKAIKKAYVTLKAGEKIELATA
jgi:large subunit ribosomal protein L23